MTPGPRLRVAVDAAALLGPRTGIGQVTARLVEGLAARDDIDLRAYAISRRGRHDLAAVLPPGVEPAASSLPARAVHRSWARVPWPTIEHWTGPVDVVHSPNFVAPPARAPVIVTVHDMTFVSAPELCRPEAVELVPLLRRAIARGATVHTVSDHVARQVREYFALPAERVVRVYAGIAGEELPGDGGRGHELAGGDRYVIAIGTVEPRKNLPSLVRAFDALAAADATLRLVVVGPDGWGVDAYDVAVAAAAHRDRVVRLGYVGEQERGDLLAGATALAYPSLDEGFGHPPFEAMRAGIPVVTTRAGALPEAVGDAAVLVEPGDDDALAGALERVLTDDALRAELVTRGQARVARYPWPQAIDEFVALYRRVAERASVR
jgi:glycosyltransferase involved in cell wall biosynthesis